MSPAELEAHLLSLDVLDDAAVVASPNDRCGEVPVAFVVLSAVGRQHANQDPDAVKESIKMSVQEAKVLCICMHAGMTLRSSLVKLQVASRRSFCEQHSETSVWKNNPCTAQADVGRGRWSLSNGLVVYQIGIC